MQFRISFRASHSSGSPTAAEWPVSCLLENGTLIIREFTRERIRMHGFGSLHAIWLVFLGSALLEVGGDAVVRKGLRASSILLIVAGGLMLAGYGLLVNLVRWDFSRLLGVYVAVFTLVSVLFGRFVFGENIPASTWVGLAVVMAGGLIIQFGQAG